MLAGLLCARTEISCDLGIHNLCPGGGVATEDGGKTVNQLIKLFVLHIPVWGCMVTPSQDRGMGNAHRGSLGWRLLSGT